MFNILHHCYSYKDGADGTLNRSWMNNAMAVDANASSIGLVTVPIWTYGSSNVNSMIVKHWTYVNLTVVEPGGSFFPQGLMHLARHLLLLNFVTFLL